MKKIFIPILTGLTSTTCFAVTLSVSTEFNTSDGFVTGDTAPATIVDASGSSLVVFSGGQQQQSFFGGAYNQGPAAYIYSNGGAGFRGITPTGDQGLISFSRGGATTVTFHAANLAQGAATTFTALGTDGTTLGTALTQVSALNGTDPNEIITFNAVGGVNIGSIIVDLPGPAANAPYAAAVDTFSVTLAAVPEPSTSLLVSLFFGMSVLRRRR